MEAGKSKWCFWWPAADPFVNHSNSKLLLTDSSHPRRSIWSALGATCSQLFVVWSRSLTVPLRTFAAAFAWLSKCSDSELPHRTLKWTRSSVCRPLGWWQSCEIEVLCHFSASWTSVLGAERACKRQKHRRGSRKHWLGSELVACFCRNALEANNSHAKCHLKIFLKF